MRCGRRQGRRDTPTRALQEKKYNPTQNKQVANKNTTFKLLSTCSDDTKSDFL